MVSSVLLTEEKRFALSQPITPDVEAGGGRVEDIIKVTFWVKAMQRKPINDEWVEMFPDPASRPARQIMEVPMEPGVLVQCDFMAVVGEGWQ